MGTVSDDEIVWRELNRAPGDINLKRAGHSCVTFGSKLFIAGGYRSGNGQQHDLHDLLIYDTGDKTWETKSLPASFCGCRYHTAQLVGYVIWFIGGFSLRYTPDKTESYEAASVHTYNIELGSWREHIIRSTLLLRHGHAACCNPLNPHSILIHGGTRLDESLPSPKFAALDTARLEVKEVKAVAPDSKKEAVEGSRRFASFTAVGEHCVLVGGRRDSARMVEAQAACLVYSPADNCWVDCPPTLPNLRSGHRAVAMGEETLYILGGAQQDGYQLRDLLRLKINPSTIESTGLEWSVIYCSTSSPSGRHSPGVAVCGDEVFVVGGVGRSNNFHGDMWALPTKLLQRAKSSAAPSPVKAAGPGRGASRPAGHGRGGRRSAKPAEVDTSPANGQWRSKKKRAVEDSAAIMAARLACRADPAEPPLLSPAKRNKVAMQPAEEDTVKELKRLLEQSLQRYEDLKVKQARELVDLKHSHSESIVRLRNELIEAREQVQKETEGRRDAMAESDARQRVAVDQHDKLQRKMQAEVDAKSRSVTLLQAEVKDAEQSADRMNEQIFQLTRQLTEARSEVTRLTTGLQQAKIEADCARKEKDGAQLASDEAIRKLREEADNTVGRTAELMQQNSHLKQDLSEWKAKLQIEREHNTALLQEKDRLTAEAQEVAKRHAQEQSALLDRLAKESTACTTVLNEKNHLLSELQATKTESARAKQQREEAVASRQKMQEAMDRLTQKLEKSQDDCKTYRRAARDALIANFERGQESKKKLDSIFADDPVYPQY